MCERMSECLEMLGEEVEVSKRELGLGLLCCLLLGIVIGMIFSPRKRVMIGSNNGSGNSAEGCCTGGCDCCDEE